MKVQSTITNTLPNESPRANRIRGRAETGRGPATRKTQPNHTSFRQLPTHSIGTRAGPATKEPQKWKPTIRTKSTQQPPTSITRDGHTTQETQKALRPTLRTWAPTNSLTLLPAGRTGRTQSRHWCCSGMRWICTSDGGGGRGRKIGMRGSLLRANSSSVW